MVDERVAAALREFYELCDTRDKEAVLARFAPGAVLRDHRPLGTWGGSPEEWLTMVEGWWTLIPDVHNVVVDVLRTEPNRNLHEVVFGGMDNLTGGLAENHFFAVSITTADGLIATTDFFDDEASATAHYERLG